jgi:hypothetical protein
VVSIDDFIAPVERPAIRVLDHVVAGGNLDDDACDAARLTTLILRDAAGEREDFSFQAEGRDVGDGGLVLLGHGRHAGLDAVDAERVQLLGDRDLLSRRKTTAVCCSPSRSVTS